MSLTASERSLRARVAAFSLHSQVDGRAHTAPARQAFEASFELQVDPDGVLPAKERQRRAEAARRAHFARMALASSKARRARKASSAPDAA